MQDDETLVLDTCADESPLEAALRLARTGCPARAHGLALGALERAQQRNDARELAMASQILAATCLMMGQCETGIVYAREARALFTTLGDLPQAARAGANLAWLLATIGEPDAIVTALTAFDTAEHAGDPTEIIWALDTNAIVLWLLKQVDQALPFAERAVELSRMHKPRLQRPLINLAGLRMELALQAREEGEALQQAAAQAVAMTEEALLLCRAAGDGWLERLALCNIAEYHLHAGDTASAEAALAQIPDSAGEMSDRCTYQYLHMLGRVRAAQGRPREAIEVLQSCLEVALRSGDLETASPCCKDLSELYVGLGAFEQALECHRAFHDLYVRQASDAAQRRARLTTLEWEAERLRASVNAALQQAADLTATNRVLAQETERLLRASMEDPLTGLQNRRRLDLAFLDTLACGRPYAIAMIDIDNFKQVNDCYTHPVGDAVLRAVAELLRQNARTEDVIVRFGGDEFALLLRDADHAGAVSICERLRHGAQTRDWTGLHPLLRVSLSIGVACSHEAGSHEDVLSMADRRLYCAKKSGRNRVVAG